jgi:hypothetical protein
MRFLTRSLTGLLLMTVTLALLGLAVASIKNAQADRADQNAAQRPNEERIFAVNVATLTLQSISPVLVAYGDLRSAAELELRAQTSGTLLELAPGFRDGGLVSAGETLFLIDPAESETGLALAESDLAAAHAEEREADIGLALAHEELAAAERQNMLRKTALGRAKDLRERGVSTAAALEIAELAVAAGEQAVTGRRLALAQADARTNRASIATARAEIERDKAVRELENTRETAPFDGVLSNVDAVRGRLVSVNEKLGLLIDPTKLEVAFRVSNSEYRRLTDQNGALLPLKITATLEADGDQTAVAGRIDRAGVSSEAGKTGRLIYASLEAGGRHSLRPGDFLTVKVAEPPLDRVADVPSTAIGPSGTLLLLSDDQRVEEIPVRILRRQENRIIIGDVPFGRTYLTERLPQLGTGVRVRPLSPQTTNSPAKDSNSEIVKLTDEQQATLVARVNDNEDLPGAVKDRIISALNSGSVSRRMLNRIETGAKGG